MFRKINIPVMHIFLRVKIVPNKQTLKIGLDCFGDVSVSVPSQK